MRSNCLLKLVFVLFSGILHAQISTTCVPSVSIVTSAINNSICIGQSASYTVSGGVNYTFLTTPSTSPTFTGNTGVVTPTTHTSYQVIGTNQFGCTSAAQQIIFVNQLPQISIAASPTMICFGLSSTLTALGAPSNTVHLYNWGQGGNSSKSVVGPTVNSIYTVTGTNTITSCQNTQTISVAVFNPTFSVIPDTGVCKGNVITLTASGAKTYTWAGGVGPSSGSLYIVSPTVATIYTVGATTWTVNGALKCNKTNTVLVEIYPQPTVTASRSFTGWACPGQQNTLTGHGASTYYWAPINQSGSTVVVAPYKSITYSVIGTDLHGCKDTSKLLIIVNIDCYLGVAESAINRLRISIFPNPSDRSLTISVPAPLRLDIYNLEDQIIKTITVNSAGDFTFDTSDISPGVYLLKGKSLAGLVCEKFIVRR